MFVRYLVKAYLGVLHNVARLCADSRKMFRSANAVAVLRAYLDRAQGLVRTKVRGRRGRGDVLGNY
jgi:hypothetical protein